MTTEPPPVAALCGDGPGRRTGPKLTVSLNPYVCPWCDGKGRWNADGERCMNCSGAGVTDDPTPGVDIDGNEVPAVPLPRPPAVMRSPCVDCAYRPGSPEEDSTARPDASEPFFCHTGMHRVGEGYQPAAWVGAMPLGYMVCAGWWALLTGDELPERPFVDRRRIRFGDDRLPARYWSKVERRPGGCWIWTGARTGPGQAYGSFGWNGKGRRAHVVAYEVLVEPVPHGMEVDHRCHTADCKAAEKCPHRACVNPAHLRPATRRENLLRGNTFVATHAAVTHCPAGHAYDEANTYIRPDRNTRDCRKCRAATEARRRARRRAERLAGEATP